MILVDTSVVIEFIRTANAKMRRLIVSNHGAVCGVTRAEVLHGTRDAKHRSRLLKALNFFDQVATPESTWDTVGDHCAILRAQGITVPFADVIVATLAIQNDIELWTRDNQFLMIQKALPQLKLFQEPP